MNSQQNITSCWPSGQGRLDKHEEQQLLERTLPVFKSILVEEKIPLDSTLIDALSCFYIPFAKWLIKQQKDKPLIVGINGSQGSGKSTITKILSAILEQGFAKRVVRFSIDDLYKRKADRHRLASDVHPLFATRGVPGTHDISLGISIIRHLLNKDYTELKIPVFDKSIDDRLPESEWVRVEDECDLVIFEGWCVASMAQDDEALQLPVNKLEQLEDQSGVWRSYVNQQLKGDYASLFSLLDILVMLKIPDFSKVYEWRKLQEQKLKSAINKNTSSVNAVMNETELDRFIMHYERITRHTLNEMPDRADVILELGDDHRTKKIIVRG